MPDLPDHKCANCNATLEGKYCHVCGQPDLPADHYRLGSILRQAFFDITDLDSKFLTTTRLLLLRPGFLAEEFFQGRRASYLSPVRLYIIFSVIYFIVFSFRPDRNIYSVDSIYYTDITGTVKSMVEQIIREKDIDEGELYEEFTRIVGYSLYLQVFVFAILFNLIFILQKRYFAEHLIFSLHLMTFIFLVDIILSPLYFFTSSVDLRVWTIIVVACFYSVWAIRRFYRQSTVKSFLIVVTFSVLFWVSGIGIAFLSLMLLLLTY